MTQKQQIQTISPVSQLERFNLGFEYDKTLRELKHEMRIRTLN